MSKSHEELSETHIVGSTTTEWVVAAKDCPELGVHFIKHVGVVDAAAPCKMVRMKLSGAYLMASLEGAGLILLDGRWRTCRKGLACMAPPHARHAFHATQGKRWKFCWVRYEQPSELKPMISVMAPVLAKYDGRPLASAIMGLRAECEGVREAQAIHHWVELIQMYALRFAHPWRADDRLGRLWSAVGESPGENWTLAKLAQMSHSSAEHLRRLCQRELGRSPMRQVTHLRMQHAVRLLQSTDDTIESVAGAVGYANPYVFSNTFKKWTGRRPSAFRSKNRGHEREAR